VLKRINLDFIVLLFIFFLFIAFTFLPFYFSNINKQLWKDYYLLCVKKGYDYKEKLSGFVWDDIICYENTSINLSVYNDIEEVALENLDSRLDERDPRLDPYMKELGDYFFGDDSWNYIFIPSNKPVQYVFINLFFSLPGYGTQWIISDFNISREILSILFTVVFFLLIFNLKDKNRMFTSFSFIPWLVIILTGSFYDLITFFIVFPALFLIIDIGVDLLKINFYFSDKSIKDNPDFKNLAGRFLYLIISVIVSFLSRITNDNLFIELFRILFPVFSCFGILSLYYYFNKIRINQSSHTPFYPVSILRENKWKKLNKPVLILIPLMIILVPIIFSIEAPLSRIKVPAPYVLKGAEDFSWNSLEMLNKYEPDSSLPDISDYVIHMAFQEGFVYGAEYQFPEGNRELIVDSYKENSVSGEIEKYYEVVLKFDQLWLEKILGSIQRGSLPKLLLDQEKPVYVIYSTKDMYFTEFSIWNCLGMIVFVFFPIFFIESLWTSNQLYGNKESTRKLPRKAKFDK